MAPENRSYRSVGFTLVELLVVLVIVSLVGGILLTGFERVLDIRLRLAEFLDGVEAPVLVADWFRETIRGLVADTSRGADRFNGGPRKMTGLSLAPLNRAVGVPTRVDWELAFNDATGRSELLYRNDTGSAMTLASWPGDSGGFQYCDQDMVCHASWPPAEGATQLPLLIRLDAVKGSQPWVILAAPEADRNPLQTRTGGS